MTREGIRAVGMLSGGLDSTLAASLVAAPAIVRAQSLWRNYPFSLGIASGDPAPDVPASDDEDARHAASGGAEDVALAFVSAWVSTRRIAYDRTVDVIVASNLFGDILTDLGAAISGSLGLAPGANLNPEREHPSMFEPIHGSAPKYTGQYRVNPIGIILAARMMLDYLEENEMANALESAIAKVIRDGKVRTYDMGGAASTLEMAKAIAEKI